MKVAKAISDVKSSIVLPEDMVKLLDQMVKEQDISFSAQNPTHKTTQQGVNWVAWECRQIPNMLEIIKKWCFSGGAGSCSAIQSEQMGAIGVAQSLNLPLNAMVFIFV